MRLVGFLSLLVLGGMSSLQAIDSKPVTSPELLPPPPVIIIDPGHGGKDPGAISKSSKSGAREKDVTLAISRRLAAALKKRLKSKVILTRSQDRFISLAKRDEIANRHSCDLFLSIHANASTNPKAQGLEIYYLNKATDSASRRLAARENMGAPRPEKEIEAIVSDLIQTASTEESADLSGHLRKSLQRRLGKKFGIKKVNVKTALFYVLVGAKCPSLLIETGFITHPEEGRRLRRAAFQKDFSEAVAEGVGRYLVARENPGGDL